MVARVVIGKLPGGGYGMRASLPGHDVLGITSGADANLSFSSDWTSVNHIHVAGIASAGATVSFTNLGYRPFIHVRGISGNTLTDDWNIQTPPTSANGSVGGYRTGFIPRTVTSSSFGVLVHPSTGFGTAFYVVYKISSGF